MHASIGLARDAVFITISDNGRGFPFQGRYGLAEMEAMRQGPKSIKERITALKGGLSIDSSNDGAVLEMSVPLKTATSFSEASLNFGE